MFLVLSLPSLLYGNRLEFSARSRSILWRAVADPPYHGRCPCCLGTTVLTPEGQPASGAEFDHVFHARLNRPEMGWLICFPCHDGLSHGGYLARHARLPAFRTFQEAVLRQRETNRHANRERTA